MSLYLTSHRSLFPAMRTAREISALLTTLKFQFWEGLFNILAILDTITRDNVYVIFLEAVDKMAHKC